MRVLQVGAMDDKLLEKLAMAGVNTFSMNSGLTTEDFGWGSKSFHKMVLYPYTPGPRPHVLCALRTLMC